MIQKVSSILLGVFLLGCGTTKQLTQVEDLPEWVKTKPVSGMYYIGVGAAHKTPQISEYQNAAKNNALADLASEISVNISTSSVFHKFESTLGYSEDFSAATKASAQEQLEGFELVNTHESSSHYYVYYRLSKQKHAELKAQRKSEASEKALDFYKKAELFKSENDYYQCISNYVKGLEAIKPYLSETVEASYENHKIYLGNELFVGFQNSIYDIHIKPVHHSLEVKKGQAIASEELTFFIENGKSTRLVGIPVIFTLGTLPLRNSKVSSDTEGKVFYQFNEVKTKADQVYFVASLDMNTISSSITSDPLFRKMIRKMDPPKSQVHILLKKPSFYIETSELNMDKELDTKIIQTKLQQLLASKGFPVVTEKQKADYTIVCELNTRKQKHEGRMYYASMQGNLKIYNTHDEMVLVKPISSINGVALDYNAAGMKAYDNLISYLNKNLLIKLKEAMKNG